MIRLLHIFLILAVSLSAKAYDLVVILENADTKQKITDLDVGAYDMGFNNIGWPTLNLADSTFVFIGLPDQAVNIMFLLGGQIAGGTQVPQPTSEIKMSIPSSVLPKTLNEVEVRARNIYMADNMTVLVPTTRDKQMSADGAALLRNMAIAELNISPVDNSITTVSGDVVEKFIDYQPATDADLRNIRSGNVVRIETFENPSDPRFKGARHVVNFIMQRYEYGGYTKLFGNQSFINNKGDYNVYSKLGYRSMVYEASAGYNYARSTHDGTVSDRKYLMPSGLVTQHEATDDSFNKTHGAFGLLKAVYSDKTRLISNLVGVTYSGVPESWSNSSETFSSSAYLPGISSRKSDADNIGMSWKGEYQFTLPSDFSLIFTPSASYADYKNNSFYKADEDVIENYSQDKAWSLDVSAQLSRRFGRHTVSLKGYYYHAGHNLNYRGTVPSEVMSHTNTGTVGAEAFLNFGRITFIPSLNVVLVNRNVNGIVTHDHSVRPFVQLMYQINDKHRLVFGDFVQYMTVPANQLGDNYVLTSQISGTRGNPRLKDQGENTFLINYSWMPSNILNLSAFVNYQYVWRIMASIYEPMIVDGREYMLATTINNGHSNNINYGVAVGLRPIGGLSLRAALNARTAMIRSLTRYSGTELSYDIQASYSFSKFYVSAYYISQNTLFHPNYKLKTPQNYGLTAGWGNGDLNVAITARNPFTSSYLNRTVWLDRDNFSVCQVDYSNALHRSFELSISYSFGYGKKKIDRNNEAQKPTAVESGIMK